MIKYTITAEEDGTMLPLPAILEVPRPLDLSKQTDLKIVTARINALNDMLTDSKTNPGKFEIYQKSASVRLH